jgi:hypothetical protein
MKSPEDTEKLLALLRSAYRAQSAVEPSAYWARKVMSEVYSLSTALRAPGAAEEGQLLAGIFLRFSFAVLLLTLLVQTVVEFSPIEQSLSVSRLSQLDPFDFDGAFDGDFNE